MQRLWLQQWLSKRIVRLHSMHSLHSFVIATWTLGLWASLVAHNTLSIVIIIVYCYEYHDVNNFLCDSFPNANHSSN